MNNTRSKLLKIAVSIIAIVVLVVCGIYTTRTFSSKDEGHIIVEVIDIKGTKLKEKEIPFNKGDDIVKLLQHNLDDVVYKDGMVMEIEGLKTPEDWSTFICVYVNDEMSMVGISEIEFVDGDKISFIETEVLY